MQIDQSAALELVRIFKDRIGQKQSWRAVQRFLVKAEHQYAFLVTGQKLANWNNPKRKTQLEPKAFDAVLHFIQTSEFQAVVPEAKRYLDQSGRAIEAGATVTELSGIYPLEETESILFKALDGMWCDRDSRIHLYIHKVEGHNFAIVHLCQKIHVGYKSALGFPRKDYADFFASGFLYFENETHSNNKGKFEEKSLQVGQVERFSGDLNIHRIGVSGKEMRLKLWSRRNHYEVNHEASCHCRLRDSGYEPCNDCSISVSEAFSFLFNSTNSDHVYRFDRANYVKADNIRWGHRIVSEVEYLKEKFDQIKWSVLPNVTT